MKIYASSVADSGVVLATLIGDVIGSRGAEDRQGLDDRLVGVLGRVNAELEPATPLRVTVGDEYQGAFAHVADAIAASLRIQLLLAPEYSVRHGIGWGEVTVLREDPRVEDGPGWWAARAAIERLGSSWSTSRMQHTLYLRTLGKPARDSQAGFLMTREPHRQRAQSAQREIDIVRTGAEAERP